MTLLIALYLACGRGPATTSPATTTDTHQHDEYCTLPEGEDGFSEHFATSGECALCHANSDAADAMRTSAEEPVGMVDLWQGTMMANAARDPLFRAAVSAEAARHPDAEAAIHDVCLTCHAPMARTERALAGEGGLHLDDLAVEGQDATLGLDGVSCTVCHQIQPDGLGEQASWSGGFVVTDAAELYGPHADPNTHPMEMHVGYTPVQADHVRSAELCATCHTLRTATLVDSQPTGDSLAEQTPYLEWRSSSYASGANPTLCQDCHMPTTDGDGQPISTAIATNPHGEDMGSIGDRTPYGQHGFAGGNTLMLQILRDNADVLSPRASTADFDAAIARNRALLQRAAGVAVLSGQRADGQATVTVQVANLSGHKLPTGHPSRRAWLRLEATASDGSLVFRSGGFDAQGRLVDGDGSLLETETVGGPVQPHHDQLSDDQQVQVYQAVMADPDGAPTFALLSGAGWVVDDRLLPIGWDPDVADLSWVDPVGVDEDDNFVGGTDEVTYRFPTSGPVTVTASLLYQPVSPRYVAELAGVDTPEVRDFIGMWEAADRSPEVLAETTTQLP